MKSKKCTWKGCSNFGKHSHKDKLGQEWAYLCDIHHNELEEALNAMTSKEEYNGEKSIRKMLSAWVKARGGANNIIRRG